MRKKLRALSVFPALLFLYNAICFGQSSPIADSIKVEEIIKDETHTDCNAIKVNHSARESLQGDSLHNCLVSKTFTTDHINVYYIREFDLKGKVREEGYAKGIWVQKKILGIKTNSRRREIQKDGAWRFYDGQGLLISDCCYKNGVICNGCLWAEYDAQGYKLREYKIDW